jgi:hypothetical protein
MQMMAYECADVLQITYWHYNLYEIVRNKHAFCLQAALIISPMCALSIKGSANLSMQVFKSECYLVLNDVLYRK